MGDAKKVERELVRGAGALAVLHLLAKRPMYGYELAEALDRETSGVLALGHSTLYPMLYGLEARGLITGREAVTDSGRKRRYYHVTAAGRRELRRQRSQWRELARGMRALGLDGTPEPA